MTKTRPWLLVVALVTLVGLIFGCSGSGTAAAGKPEQLNVEVFDRGQSVNGETAVNSIWNKWIQDQVLQKLNIEVTFVPVPRSQEVDKLNVLMATGDAPDIVFTYSQNTVSNYAKSGGLTDVSTLLDQYGQDLKAYLGDDLLAYGKFFGKQYAIAAKRAFVGDVSSLIRKDWLAKLNLPVPATTDEFLKTMKAFKEKDPGNTGGKTVPYGFVSFEATYNISRNALLNSFIQWGPEQEFYAKYIGENSISGFMMPGYKDGVRFLNTMYNEGLISKDFPLDKDGKKFAADFTNGYIGALTETGTFVLDIGLMEALTKNVPDAEYVAMDAFTDSNGRHPKQIYAPLDKYILIPKASKHAEAAVKYLNWMADKDNLSTIVNGFEGEDYKLVNGLPVKLVQENPQHLSNGFDLGIITNGLDYGSDEKNIQFYVGNKVAKYPELGTELLKISLVDGYVLPRFDRPIDAQIKYGSVLRDKTNEVLTKAVTAKPADFNQIFDDGMKEFLSLGGQAVVEERTKAYQDMKAGN